MMKQIFRKTELTESQKRSISELRSKLKKGFRRPSFIFTGSGGYGKTFAVRQLLKTISESVYYNISRDHLNEIFENVSSDKLLNFIKKLDGEYNNTLIVIDECDPIILQLYQNKELGIFLSTLGRFSSINRNKILIVFSIKEDTDNHNNFNIPSFNGLLSSYGREKIVVLEFNKDDVEVIADNCGIMPEPYNNIYEIINKKL